MARIGQSRPEYGTYKTVTARFSFLQEHRVTQALSRGANARATDPREGDKNCLHFAADGSLLLFFFMTLKPRVE